MTVLQTIGKYEIISEKVDECPPNWAGLAAIFGFLGAVIIILIPALYASLSIDLNPLQKLWISFWGCIPGVIFFFIVVSVSFLYVKCGVKITLKKIDSAWGEKGEVLYAITYQFTNDDSKDAEKIKTLVNMFVNEANQLMRKYKVGDEKREQCHNKYVSTLQKVKLD
jgi:signal transduction histidine kinase